VSLPEPFINDPDFQLHVGDALEMLRVLPSASVHCALTSPPFYGLRDYGTGSWEGGDDGCDHVAPKQPERTFTNGRGENEGYAGSNLRSWTTRDGTTYRDVCGKCGARRVDNQIGLEATPDEWVARLVEVFREVRRVLRDDGTLWVEIGDSYCANNAGVGRPNEGHVPNAWQHRDVDITTKGGAALTPMRHPFKQKDLVGGPWLLAFALRADGWYLRSEIIWDRPNPMPESVTDRPTKSHSTVFLLAKSPRYFFDAEAVRESSDPWNSAKGFSAGGLRAAHGVGTAGGEQWNGTGTHEDRFQSGRNVRSVWRIATQPTPFAHFATWPEKLVERIILAGTSERGCCPECGAPWEREMDVERLKPSLPSGNREIGSWNYPKGGVPHDASIRTHVGWRRTCEHDWQLAISPCTVLDPFMGSGTTALVARRLGRRSVGVELSESYSRLCAERLSQLSLFAEPANG
jgi:DNA modification methylase